MSKARRSPAPKSTGKRHPDRRLVSVIMLFFFSAFLLISLKEQVHWQGLALAVLVPALLYIAILWLPRFFPADKLLLAIANFLCALGVLILYSTDQGTDTTRGLQQAVYYGIGIGAMLFCILLVRYVHRWKFMIILIMGGAAVLLALPLAIGTEQNGATNWINIGGTSMQPSEVVKIALLLILSYYLSERRFVPWFLFAGFSLGGADAQRDLGTALIYYATTLFMFYASTGISTSPPWAFWAAAAGLLGLCDVRPREKAVAIWRNPDLLRTSGYQIVQMLMATPPGLLGWAWAWVSG